MVDSSKTNGTFNVKLGVYLVLIQDVSQILIIRALSNVFLKNVIGVSPTENEMKIVNVTIIEDYEN